LGIVYPIADIASFLSKKFADIKFHPLSFSDNLEFWCGKIINFGLYFILGFYLHGISFFPVFMMYQMVGGFYLAATFAVSHNVVEIDQTGGNKAKDWAELQIIESTNWSTSSWVANFLTGGLNAQIEHHLFPGIGSRHYPALAKIVEKKCKEKNIPYLTYDSFFMNYYSFFLHLKKLGEQPTEPITHNPTFPLTAPCIKQTKQD